MSRKNPLEIRAEVTKDKSAFMDVATSGQCLVPQKGGTCPLQEIKWFSSMYLILRKLWAEYFAKVSELTKDFSQVELSTNQGHVTYFKDDRIQKVCSECYVNAPIIPMCQK